MTTLTWLNAVTASTVESYYRENPIDNVFDENPAIERIKQKSQVKVIRDGDIVEVPLMLGMNSQGKAYSYYDTFDLQPESGFYNAPVSPARYAIPVLVSDQEIDDNTGEAKVFDILEAKITQAELSLLDMVSDDMYVAQVVSSNNTTRTLLGLADMIYASESANTYMGVSNASWTNKYETITEATLLSGFSAIYRKLRDGSVKPDLILCSDRGISKYEDAITLSASGGLNSSINFVNSGKETDYGFADFNYKGTPLVADKHFVDYSGPKAQYLWLNCKHIGFMMDTPEVGEWVKAQNGMFMNTFLKTKIWMFTNNRRRQGKLTATS